MIKFLEWLIVTIAMLIGVTIVSYIVYLASIFKYGSIVLIVVICAATAAMLVFRWHK